MLSKLVIENYALIDHLEMDFSEGFSVITGETGAGKSILLGALSLILGNRGDASVLLDTSRKCIVEGTFTIKGYHLEELFSVHELDYEDTAILRREILQNGKSRAFINDTPVNLALMKDLGDHLVNIHSQFSIITLNDADFQLAVLDNYSDNVQIIRQYRNNFIHFVRMKKEVEELVKRENLAKNDKDYYQFLSDELEAAKLKEDEQEITEKRLDILSHAEEIKTGLLHALEILSLGEQNIADRLSEITNVTNNLSRFHSSLKEISERVRSNQIDLRDIAAGMEKIEQDVDFNPAEINSLTGRLDLIYRLEKKHNVSDIRGLLTMQEQLNGKLQEATSVEDRILVMNKEMGLVRDRLIKEAEKLSGNRRKVIPELEERIRQTLIKLGMQDARIKIELTHLEELTPDGMDIVRFMFSANKGIGLSEISRIASGGELSRLMLSIKSLISQKNLLPTIIFDEIDMGVSGEVAGKVGEILKKMGESMQVIAITHLPQIAGKGQSHYWVFKSNESDSARTQLKKLDQKERVHEIAKMLSNEKVSDAALKTAKELMGK
ncbi:MAG: DNA repair protein RecN [Bacteroidetes bacterium]|nr:MAG: DNA repair protein RecN [Bacteroidota bacterium]